MSSGSASDECGITTDRPGVPPVSFVGPPYLPGEIVPDGLHILLALIDGAQWPLQVAGDTGVGVNADAWGGIEITECDTITALDDGPIPNGVFPADPPIYPGVGITAYGCQMNCTYVISGSLGSSVIVGKIDNQWHILRVLGSASTTPMFGPSNECRCCGNSLKDVKLRARVYRVTPDNCGPYRACDEFRLDPLSTALGYNPMEISLTCQSSEGSLFEDVNDWTAYAFGNEVTVVSVTCCAPYDECEDVCERLEYSGVEVCYCCGSDSSSASSSVSASVSASVSDECRFEAVIEFTHDGCEYRILIWAPIIDDDDPCTLFTDEYIEDVIAEANGLPQLVAGDRVIIARIPSGITGRQALNGADPVEWFIIRACTAKDCAFPCEGTPPQGPPCCGVLCSEMPNGLTATIEVISSACCSGSLSVAMTKEGIETQCDGASDTAWFVHDLTDPNPPEIVICTGVAPGFPPYPTKIAINNLELICGSAENECADSMSTSASDDDIAGPLFSLWVSYYNQYVTPGAQSRTLATQDRTVSCCSPLYLEYEITIPVCFIAGAGVISATTTLRITITE
jgi:hypothetical protein